MGSLYQGAGILVFPSGYHTGCHPETALPLLSGWLLSGDGIFHINSSFGAFTFPHRPGMAAHLFAGSPGSSPSEI